MKRTVEAQMPPMGPDPMGGAPPMGPDPMGGMGGPPMGGPPGAPGAPGEAEKPSIAGPLSSIGEILYDFDIEKFIAMHPAKTQEELAEDVWEAYGGNSDDTVDADKVGERSEKDSQRPPEEVTKEVENTEETKWKRLPIGKTIADITSVAEIKSLMNSLIFGTIKMFKTPAAPPGGGMPPLAATKNDMTKLAADIKKDLINLQQHMKKKR